MEQQRVRMTFERTKEGIEIPTYKHDGDACMDLRVYPDEATVLHPGEHRIFDTYLKFDIPVGYVLDVYARSGLGIKNGVVPRNCVGIIDSNYTETVKVGLVNSSNEDYVVSPGDRVAQFRLIPFPFMELVEGKVADSNRGEGLGSSGVQ